MKKVFVRLIKLNNKGFSLVEILVTIAIIGIVIVPILSSFTLAARINANAGKLQNATLLAQSISEEFKAMTLESLEKTYGAATVETDADGNATGRLVFSNIGFEDGKNYFKGAGGETFYVTVILDPNEYKNVTGINDYKIPALSDLYNNSKHGPMVLKSEIIKSDNDIYGSKGFNISRDQAQYITKETTVILECEAASEGTTEYYFMDCYLDITYKYAPASGGTQTYTTGKVLVQSYTLDVDEATPPLYICYNTFDIYSKNLLINSSDTCSATDVFNFDYVYTGDSAKERDVNVYLAQQVTNHSETTLGLKSALNKANVHMSEDANLSIYTNILNWEGNELTSSDKTIDSLYKMTVTISGDEAGTDVVTTFDSTKEN